MYEDIIKTISLKERNNFVKQLDEDKIGSKYKDVLINEFVKKKEGVLKEEINEVKRFILYVTMEFGSYDYSSPKQPRFAVYSEEVEDLDKCMKKVLLRV